MVSKGLAGAASLALALASVGAFAPGTAFVRNPLNPASYGIDTVVDKNGAILTSSNVRVFVYIYVCVCVCPRILVVGWLLMAMAFDNVPSWQDDGKRRVHTSHHRLDELENQSFAFCSFPSPTDRPAGQPTSTRMSWPSSKKTVGQSFFSSESFPPLGSFAQSTRRPKPFHSPQPIHTVLLGTLSWTCWCFLLPFSSSSSPGSYVSGHGCPDR